MQAQKNIPTAVIQAFNKQYKGATEIEWEQEDEHEYEVNFIYKGVDYTANYDDKGNWLETAYEIQYSALPQKVKAKIEANEDIKQIHEIARIENAKGEVYFEIEFKSALLPLKVKYYDLNGSELIK